MVAGGLEFIQTKLLATVPSVEESLTATNMSRDDGTELALSGVTNGSLDDKGELREQLSRASQEIHRLQEELRREREETRTKVSTQDSFLSQAFGHKKSV